MRVSVTLIHLEGHTRLLCRGSSPGIDGVQRGCFFPRLDPTRQPAMPQGAQFLTQENLEDTPQQSEHGDGDSQLNQANEGPQPDNRSETERYRAAKREPNVTGNLFPQTNGLHDLEDPRSRCPEPDIPNVY